MKIPGGQPSGPSASPLTQHGFRFKQRPYVFNFLLGRFVRGHVVGFLPCDLIQLFLRGLGLVAHLFQRLLQKAMGMLPWKGRPSF